MIFRKTLGLLVLVVVALFVFNLVYIMAREQYDLPGCVFCEEANELVLTKTSALGLKAKQKSTVIYGKVLGYLLEQLQTANHLIRNYLNS